MRISFLLATALACLSTQASFDLTYSKILGKDEVRRIVLEVLDKKVKELNRMELHGPSATVSYDQSFVEPVLQRVLDTELAPGASTETAESALRKGFGQFVDNVVSFAKEHRSTPAKRLTKEIFEEYMNRPKDQQKCGEIPCNSPPCCKYCAPPPCKIR